jgi:N-acetylneuraminic acid mutarotase
MRYAMKPRMLAVAAVVACVGTVTLPSAVKWTTTSPLLKARSGAGGATVDGRVYVLGGWTPAGLTRAAEYLRLSDRTWHSIAPMPAAKTAFGTAVVGGKIYAVGGMAYDSSGNWTALKTVYAYNPSTGVWTTRRPLPVALARAAATGLGDGRLYAFGGSRDAGFDHPSATTYAYVPATNIWKTRAPMPTPRMDASSVTSGGRAWVLGGFSPGGGYLDTNELYDPDANRWFTATSMIEGRSVPAARKAGDGHFYVVGGFNWAYGVGTTGVMDEVEEYNPRTDVWSVETNIPAARSSAATAVYKGNIYVMGGSAPDGTVTASVYILHP